MLDTLKANWRTLAPSTMRTLGYLEELDDLLSEEEVHESTGTSRWWAEYDWDMWDSDDLDNLARPDVRHEPTAQPPKELVPCSVCTVSSTHTTSVTFLSGPTNRLSVQVGTSDGITYAGWRFEDMCQSCAPSFYQHSSHRKDLRTSAKRAIQHVHSRRLDHTRQVQLARRLLLSKGLDPMCGVGVTIESFL